jgi:hypothetical protein
MSLPESFSTLIRLSSSSLADLHLNPLYVLPVTAVLILCLLVYAFGFKSTSPVPPSLSTIIQKDSKKSALKKKVKNGEKSSSSSRPAVKANGHVPAGSKSKSTTQPETRSKKQKTQTTASKVTTVTVSEVVAEDEDGGDWVPVLTKKKSQKQKQDAEKVTNVPIVAEEAEVAAEQIPAETKVVEKRPVPAAVVAEVPAVKLEVENWDTDEAVPETKEYKVKKKNVRRGKEPRSEFVHQNVAPIPDDAPAAGSGGKVVKDKITSEILANYDSVPDTDKGNAAAAKKKKEKEKRKTKTQTVSHKVQPESVPVSVVVDVDKKAAASKDSVPVVAAKGNSVKDETVISKAVAAAPEPAVMQQQPAVQLQSHSSETTDVTDGEKSIMQFTNTSIE